MHRLCFLSTPVLREHDTHVANIGKVTARDDAVAAFNGMERVKGKTIILGSERVTRNLSA